MVVGVLEKLGLRIDWALNIPSIIGFSGLLILIFYLSSRLFRDTANQRSRLLPADNSGLTIGFLSVLFFLFNGSLSFLQFFKKNPLSFLTPSLIFHNSTFPSFGPWDGGIVSAFWNLNIYTNQRHLAFGFAIGMTCIALLLFLSKKPLKAQLPFLLIFVPLLIILPFFHQPTLIIVGLFLVWYFVIFPKLRIFMLLTGVISAGPILYQLSLFSADSSVLSWYPGYLIHDTLSTRAFLLYWFHNLGLHMMLIPIGFFIAPKHVRRALFPIIPLFVIANCFKFSVEVAANHKFFNFFMVFGNMLSAYTLIFLWKKIDQTINYIGNARWGTPVERPQPRNVLTLSLYNVKRVFVWSKNLYKTLKIRGVRTSDGGKRAGQREIRLLLRTSVFFLIFFLSFSGIIDFFAVVNDQKISVVDIPKNDIANWIAKNTPKNTVILNSSYLFHPASIAGRNIFLGWPYFPWSAGYRENRMPVMNAMYESKRPEVFCPLFRKYNISYVTVEAVSGNPDLPNIDPSYFRSIAVPLYEHTDRGYQIYSTSAVCKNFQ